MKEMISKLSCGEIIDIYPETAQECFDAALDLLIQPETVTVDMSGKWPELKSFDYIGNDNLDAFGGIVDYEYYLDDVPF